MACNFQKQKETKSTGIYWDNIKAANLVISKVKSDIHIPSEQRWVLRSTSASRPQWFSQRRRFIWYFGLNYVLKACKFNLKGQSTTLWTPQSPLDQFGLPLNLEVLPSTQHAYGVCKKWRCWQMKCGTGNIIGSELESAGQISPVTVLLRDALGPMFYLRAEEMNFHHWLADWLTDWLTVWTHGIWIASGRIQNWQWSQTMEHVWKCFCSLKKIEPSHCVTACFPKHCTHHPKPAASGHVLCTCKLSDGKKKINEFQSTCLSWRPMCVLEDQIPALLSSLSRCCNCQTVQLAWPTEFLPSDSKKHCFCLVKSAPKRNQDHKTQITQRDLNTLQGRKDFLRTYQGQWQCGMHLNVKSLN